MLKKEKTCARILTFAAMASMPLLMGQQQCQGPDIADIDPSMIGSWNVAIFDCGANYAPADTIPIILRADGTVDLSAWTVQFQDEGISASVNVATWSNSVNGFTMHWNIGIGYPDEPDLGSFDLTFKPDDTVTIIITEEEMQVDKTQTSTTYTNCYDLIR